MSNLNYQIVVNLFSRLSKVSNSKLLNIVSHKQFQGSTPKLITSKKTITLSETKYSYLFLSSSDTKYKVSSNSHFEYLVSRKGYSYSNSIKKFLILFTKFKKFTKNLFSKKLKFASLSGKLLARTAYKLNSLQLSEYSHFYELSSQKSFYDRRGLRRVGKLLISTLRIDCISTLILLSSDNYTQLEQTLSANRLFLVGLSFSNSCSRNLDISIISSSKNVMSWLLFTRLISYIKINNTYADLIPRKRSYHALLSAI